MSFAGTTVITNLLAGLPATPAADVSGPALTARFNVILGVALAPDNETMYVLEGSMNAGNSYSGSTTIRKITNITNPLTRTVTPTWVTIPGTYGVTTGQIRVGPSGNVYVSVQESLLSNPAHMGYGRIGYFTPGGVWGGYIMTRVQVLGGFDMSPDEQTFFYSWTGNVTSWWDWFGGRVDVGVSQNDMYMDPTDHGYGSFCGYLGYGFAAGSGYPPGVYGAFCGSGGMWLDPATGFAWWVTNGAVTVGYNFVQVYPTIDYTTCRFPFVPSSHGTATFAPGDTQLITGPQGFTTYAGKYVAIMDGPNSYLILIDPTDGSTENVMIPGACYIVPPGGFDWGEGQGGGYMTAGNDRLYYHDQGAVYELFIIRPTPNIPTRLMQRRDSLGNSGPRLPQFADSMQLSTRVGPGSYR